MLDVGKFVQELAVILCVNRLAPRLKGLGASPALVEVFSHATNEAKLDLEDLREPLLDFVFTTPAHAKNEYQSYHQSHFIICTAFDVSETYGRDIGYLFDTTYTIEEIGNDILNAYQQATRNSLKVDDLDGSILAKVDAGEMVIATWEHEWEADNSGTFYDDCVVAMADKGSELEDIIGTRFAAVAIYRASYPDRLVPNFDQDGDVVLEKMRARSQGN